jgi:hypothetical protein
METLKPLTAFFNAIAKDGRISNTHIGIYAALLQYWKMNEFANPIEAFSYEMMEVARVSSPSTYHKCVRDLHDFGYIRYDPSFKHNQRSKVYLLLSY